LLGHRLSRSLCMVGVLVLMLMCPFYWYCFVSPQKAVLVAPLPVCGLALFAECVVCVLKAKSNVQFWVTVTHS
jgi:hypothetical protein